MTYLRIQHKPNALIGEVTDEVMAEEENRVRLDEENQEMSLPKKSRTIILSAELQGK